MKAKAAGRLVTADPARRQELLPVEVGVGGGEGAGEAFSSNAIVRAAGMPNAGEDRRDELKMPPMKLNRFHGACPCLR